MRRIGGIRRELEVIGTKPSGTYRARLAEDYNGITQFVAVTLSGSSVGAAYNAKVAAGDFGNLKFFPKGTPVVVASHRGKLEVLTLGGLGIWCGTRCLGACSDEVNRRADIFARMPIDQHGGDLEAFSDLQGNIATRLTACCHGSPSGTRGAGFAGQHYFDLVVDCGEPQYLDYLSVSQMPHEEGVYKMTLACGDTGTTTYGQNAWGHDDWTIVATTPTVVVTDLAPTVRELSIPANKSLTYWENLPRTKGRFWRVTFYTDYLGVPSSRIFRANHLLARDSRCLYMTS